MVHIHGELLFEAGFNVKCSHNFNDCSFQTGESVYEENSWEIVFYSCKI